MNPHQRSEPMRTLLYLPSSPLQRFGLVLAFAFLATLASKGMAVLPGYAVDDYGVSNLDQSLTFYLSQGRYTQALLQWAATELDMRVPTFYWPSTVLILLALPLAVAFGATRIGDERTPVAWQCVGAALICAHPYFSEYFTFRQALFNASVYVVLMAVHLYYAYRIDVKQPLFCSANRSPLILSSAAMAFALGGHQLVFPMTLAFVAMSLIVSWRDRQRPWMPNVSDLKQLAPLIIGVACYLILHVVIKQILGNAGDPRGQLLDVSQIHERIGQVSALIRQILWSDEPLLSGAAKVLLIVPAGALLIAAGFRAPFSTLWVLVVTIVLIAMSLAPVALSGTWWPVPRALSACGFVIGTTAVALLILAGNGWHVRMAAACFLGSSLLMVLNSAAMLQEQHRLNRWDMNKAQLITYDAVRRFGEDALEKLHFVNGNWTHASRLRTTDGDLNVSALSVPWARPALLMEASGVRAPSTWTQVDPATTECARRRAWPAEDAMYEAADVIYVCL